MNFKSAQGTKLLLFAGALVLTVLLFIAPTTRAAAEKQRPSASGGSQAGIEGMQLFRNMTVKTLDPAQKAKFEKLSRSSQFDSLQQFWAGMKQADLIALSAEEKALKTGKAADYAEAGNRYYNAVRFVPDESRVPVLYTSAMRCFSKATALDPSDTDSRIMLASCYVEGGQDPMKGIHLLREVEAVDSNNVKLQLSFAFFSVKSNQLDKAIQRFNRVLRIDSTYLEAYLHLADAYERKNELEKTISMLEQYARRTDNVTARLEVNKYIEQLKKQHN